MKISSYLETLLEAKNDIKLDILNYLNQVNYEVTNNQIQIVKITTESDFAKIFNGRGLYIILTDYPLDNNTCSLNYKGGQAIYRGHCYKVKSRLKSHLLNKIYNQQRKDNDPHYKVCLKIDDKINGININEVPYNKYNWYVIIHKMQNSSQVIREQAELAFDLKYNKPICSKE